MLITVLNKLDRWFVDIRRIQRCISSLNPENQEALYSHFFRLRMEVGWRKIRKIQTKTASDHQVFNY